MSLELFINSGSITEIDLSRIDGVRFEDAFSVSSTSCASLYYNVQDFSIPPITPPGVLNIPQTNYFMFDENASSDWDATTPTKIRISLKVLGKILDRTNYQQKLFDIIKNRRVDSEITITKQSTSGDSFKKFKVIDANYFERIYDESGQKFYSFEWGGTDLVETADFLGLFDYLPSSEDRKDGFFTLTVEQIDSGVNTSEPPTQGDELLICITPSAKYGFLDVVEANFDNLNIDNVDVTSGSMDVLEVSESIKMNGEHLMTIMGNNPKTVDHTKFRFSEATWDPIEVFQTSAGIIPNQGYFMFNEDSSINGEYGESQWRNSKPTNIRINIDASDQSLESTVSFKNKLFEILKNKYAKSKISFFQQINNPLGTQAYKEFEIERVSYFERRSKDVGVKFYKMEWGDSDITETRDLYGYFDSFIDIPRKTEKVFTDSGVFGFFEIVVKQLGPNITYVYSEAPVQDQEFNVVVDVVAVPSKQITLIDKSTRYVIPSWAKKLTIYAVGGGGGGGAGSNGFGHNSGIGLLEGRWLNSTTGYDYAEGDDKIGHEFVLGGGGGAGGSVVIAEYDVQPQAVNTNDIDVKLNALYQQRNDLFFEIGEGLLSIEQTKRLSKEFENILKEIQQLLLDRDLRLGGLPSQATLDVYVGSGGEGGKGRRQIIDMPIDQDLIQIGDTYKLRTYNDSTWWQSLFFQREHLKISSKNMGLSVAVGVTPRDSVQESIAWIATSFIAGTLLLKAGTEAYDYIKAKLSTLDYTVENPGDEYLELSDDIDRLSDIGDQIYKNDMLNAESRIEAFTAKIDNINAMKRDILQDIQQLKEFGDVYGPYVGEIQINKLDFELKVLLETNFKASLNQVVEYMDSITLEKIRLATIKYDSELWNAFLQGKAIPNAEVGWREYLETYNSWSRTPVADLIRQKTLLEMADYINSQTDAINDVLGVLNSNGLSFRDLNTGYMSIADLACIESAQLTTDLGIDWIQLNTSVGVGGYVNTVDLEKIGVYLRELNVFYENAGSAFITNPPSDQIMMVSSETTLNGEKVLFKIAKTVGSIGTSIGLNLLLPGLGTLFSMGKIIYDIIQVSDDSAVGFIPSKSNFNKNGLVLSKNAVSMLKGFEPSDPLEYSYYYNSSLLKGSNFYNTNQLKQSLDDRSIHGKNGGNTEVFYNNNGVSTCILRASGGIGGSGGYAIRGVINPLARAYGTNFDAYSSLFVPGGYGPTQTPFAKRNRKSILSNGGPGAYGVAAPTFLNWEPKYSKDALIARAELDYWKNRRDEINNIDTSLGTFDPNDPSFIAQSELINSKIAEFEAKVASLLPEIDFKNFALYQNTFKANVAFSLPGKKSQTDDYFSNAFLYTETFYGKSLPLYSSKNFNTVHQIDGFLHDRPPGTGLQIVGSSDVWDNVILENITEMPIPTPPGGGGGCGVTWQLLDRRDTKYPYFYAANNPNLVDQYKIQSNFLAKQVYLGLGGKLMYPSMDTYAYLFRDTDPTSGDLIEIKIESGGNGAFGNYYTTDGQQILARKQVENSPITTRLNDPTVSYVLAENVSNRIGAGGGGGAAYYVTDWNSRPFSYDAIDISDPNDVKFLNNADFYDPVQDGAAGGSGIVVIVAEP